MKVKDTISTDSGMKILITQEGKGPVPKKGQHVVCHYKGYLEDGTVFDSSHDRQMHFSFKVGLGQVIPGWDEAFTTLPVGTHATLIIPPNLGYGERAMGKIPAKSILIFEIEVSSIEETANA